MALAEKMTSKRTAAREKRRQQLIDATMKCIAKKGMGSTTLSDVAGTAGLSQGIVNLHFESKDNLLNETLRYLADEYKTQFDRALQRGGNSPADQLRALMELDLRPSICERRKVAVWFAFCGEAKSRPAYLRICDEYDRYYDKVLESLCQEIISDGAYEHLDASAMRMALASLTNGLWLSCLINRQSWDRGRASNAIQIFLGNVFPQHFEAAGSVDEN